MPTRLSVRVVERLSAVPNLPSGLYQVVRTLQSSERDGCFPLSSNFHHLFETLPSSSSSQHCGCLISESLGELYQKLILGGNDAVLHRDSWAYYSFGEIARSFG